MKLLTGFKLAWFGLWANRLRVLFAMMGVVIGMFAVIVLISISIGVKDTLLKQMGGLGAEQILVIPGRVLDTASGQKDFLSGLTSVPSTLTYDDAKAVEKVENVRSVTPHLETVTTVRMGEGKDVKRLQSVLVGSTDQYSRVQHAELVEGRFFTKEEQKEKARVIVLGSNIHDGLLGKESVPQENSAPVKATPEPWWKRIFSSLTAQMVVAEKKEASLVGKEVVINDMKYKVIGVLAPNATLGASTDNNVIMPIETALQETDMKNLNKMIVEAKSTSVIDQVDSDVFAAIKENHKEIDFSVVKQEQMLKALDKVTTILQVMLVGITVTALLISGTGIMNVMVMSVRERTREIGIRKALGATTFEVMVQFFFETLLLCLLGGVIGIGLGYVFIELWNNNIFIFSLVLPLWGVKLALYSSLAVGTLFGIYPALKAARMNPSKALRFE
ncbi:FtsX-like permease family protein [Bacillus aerolatus]|uniref:FtsX-like permease family protein n=1 Tax=Bacillus aerolatus TaxID=2653354 RepID=A0A6I1FRX3_9BACI|nr:ABC transporter permease [Bacillus aerolatus]KAB7707390.1 FtsX-like permease family protein [Bacillus aerolatus]